MMIHIVWACASSYTCLVLSLCPHYHHHHSAPQVSGSLGCQGIKLVLIIVSNFFALVVVLAIILLIVIVIVSFISFYLCLCLCLCLHPLMVLMVFLPLLSSPIMSMLIWSLLSFFEIGTPASSSWDRCWVCDHYSLSLYGGKWLVCSSSRGDV
jgi:hypothetical protein